jgi:TolA-binding protein
MNTTTPPMKNMTIEDLAVMTQKGFADMERRFEEMDQKFSKRFGAMHKRFDDMDARFDRLEFIVVAGQERLIEALEDKMRIVSTKLGLA